jgi:serine/threonine protein kinase
MALTPVQQAFLDSYVRKHPLKGRGKTKRADGFSEARRQAMTELDGLPQSTAERADLMKRLAAIDKQVDDDLKFKQGSADMLDLVAKAQKAKAAYRPDADLQTVAMRIDNARNWGRDALPKVATLNQVVTVEAAGLRQALRPIADTDVPDRNTMPLTAWGQALDVLIKARTADVLRVELRRQEAAALSKSVREYLTSDGPSNVESSRTLAADALKGCRSPSQRDAISKEMKRLNASIFEDPAFVPLLTPAKNAFAPADTLLAPVDLLLTELEQASAALKARLTALREQQRQTLVADQKRDPQAAGADAGKARLTDVKRENYADSINLGRTQTTERPAPTLLRKFDAQPFMNSLKLSEDQLAEGKKAVGPQDERYRQVVTASRNLFQQNLQSLGLDPDSDEIFDLSLKSPKNFAQAYTKAMGWAKPTRAQQALANAVGEGMAQVAAQANPNRFDKSTGTLTIGGITFGSAKVLNRGGVGEVSRLESTGADKRAVVVKSLITDDPGKRDEMAREIAAHKHLMKGDPDTPGRANVVEMLGHANGPDGSVHMVLEVMEGGDLDDNRLAMALAANSGALPEEARNVLNQVRMKEAVQGLKYLRDQNMVHFDIKGANFMMAADGTVKVADFGSSSVSEQGDGGVKYDSDKNLTTPGFAPTITDDVDHNFDTFALGKLFQVAHLNAGKPPTGKFSANLPPEFKDLTGALARVTKGMTDKDSDKRSVLEDVMNSAYLRNVDNYDPATVKQLNALSVQYAKAVRQESATVRGQLPAALIDQVAMASMKSKDEIGFTDIMRVLQIESQSRRDEALALRDRLEKETDPGKRFDIQLKIDAARKVIDDMKRYEGLFGKSPQVQALAQQMREVSQQLIRPGSTPVDSDDPEKQREEIKAFVKALASSVDNAATFCKFVSLRAYAGVIERMGLKQADLISIVSAYSLDLAPSTSKDKEAVQAQAAKAKQVMKDTVDKIRALMPSVLHPDASRLLQTGFKNLLLDMRKQSGG